MGRRLRRPGQQVPRRQRAVQVRRYRQPYVQVGQYKQPKRLEELCWTKNNDFIAKASITNTFGVARRLGGMSGTATTTGHHRQRVHPRIDRAPSPTPHVRARACVVTGRRSTATATSCTSVFVPDSDTPRRDHGAIGPLPLAARSQTAPLTPASSRRRPHQDLRFRIVLGARPLQDPGRVHGAVPTLGSAPRRNDFDRWYVSGLWNITGEA